MKLTFYRKTVCAYCGEELSGGVTPARFGIFLPCEGFYLAGNIKRGWSNLERTQASGKPKKRGR